MGDGTRKRSKPITAAKTAKAPKAAKARAPAKDPAESPARRPAPKSSGRAALVHVEGRELQLTNLDKVLWPEAGWTKANVVDYYTRIAPVLLPHLKDRPLTLKRYPNGVDQYFFYEKQKPKHAPEWVKTFKVPRGDGTKIDYILCNDLPTLVWLANLADLEMHTFMHRAPKIEAPTMVTFDLDPGAPAALLECCKVGLRLREAFERMGLQSHPKTSGSKGLQVNVPLNTPHTYEETKGFALAMAQLLERVDGAHVTSNMKKELRKGKIFVDWSQNDEHKTTVCVYSLRAKPRPTVSTPLTWDEVEAAVEKDDASGLTREAEGVLARAAEHGDLWKDVLTKKQKLPAL